ncbi:MAG: type IV pilus secretin PilQ [Gammaproteobacteria bacterium]|nr:type IV pilus secretin PilQ [Gammaproteobacteria bacterium]MDH3449254.1 type IV pilus secretin PilQ [Gammaproteobacteria bacterium]
MSSVNKTMKITRIMKASLASICLLAFGDASARALVGLDYSVMTGNTVQVVFTFDEPAVAPRTFTIDEPARIALDFGETENKLEQRNMQVGIGAMQSIISAASKNRTRVVLNLSQRADYTTSVSGNQVTLTLAGGEQTVLPAAETGQAQGTQASITQGAAPISSVAKGVTNIDFKRGPNGEGRVIIDLTSTSISTDVWRENTQINVELIGSQLPVELQRRMDVSDFATPIEFIDAIQDGANIRMTIASNGDFEHLAYQTDRVYTIEVAPISKEEEEKRKKEKFGFTGERLSLNFQDIEVRSVLQLLADFTGLNLVVSDSVEGNLTLRLKNVPWDQAMDIILKTKGLDQRRAGNVILIAPTDEIAAREKLELEARKQVEELERLRTEFIKVNYAKAADIAELLNLTDNAILSPRGSVSVDERTNTLLVKDTNSSLASVRVLLAELDIPVRQVLIESRVVIANDDFSKELGVRFGVSNDSQGALAPGDAAFTAGNLNGITDLVNDNTFNALDGLNVNLPVQNPAGSFALALAKLPLGTLLEMELSAAQIEGRGEVVSSPRVITADSHTARIEQGVEIPYLELDDGDATLKFRKAVLSLEVTPQITPDDRVIMDLDVHKDSQGELVSFGAGLAAPSIDTREVQSQLLVDNGQTVVLGGIYETTKTTQVTRVPFFSDLPVIGNLFKSSIEVDDRTELLIFVTPKILQGANLDIR